MQLVSPPDDSPAELAVADSELRSLQPLGESVRDALYELRLGPDASVRLLPTMSARRVNVVVHEGALQAEVEGASYPVQTRQTLQYETADALVWRNVGRTEARAVVVVRAPLGE